MARPKTSTTTTTTTTTPNDSNRILNPLDHMARTHGVVALCWLPPLLIKDNHQGATATTITSVVVVNEEEVSSQTPSSVCASFAALHVNGTVRLWKKGRGDDDKNTKTQQPGRPNDETYHPHGTIPHIFSNNKNDRALGMGSYSGSSSSSSILVACSTSGTVVVLDPMRSADDETNQTDNGGGGDGRILSVFATKTTSTNGPKATPTQITASSSTSAFAVHARLGWVAVGGPNRDIAVYNIHDDHSGSSSSSIQPFWKAKNLAPDPQTLLQPQVWPTAACFWNHDDNANNDTPTNPTNDSNLLVVGSAYRQVRIYDLRTSGSSIAALPTAGQKHKQQQQPPHRRPICYTPLDEQNRVVDHRVTALCPLNEHMLAVGDAGGDVVVLDRRTLGGGAVLRDAQRSVVGRFVGPAGSVRQMVLQHPNKTKLAVVGLDRMLRIYNIKKHQQQPSSNASSSSSFSGQAWRTVYLKQRLNCVLVSHDDGDDTEDGDHDGDIDQEDNVQDYVDSDYEDEDDVLEEMEDAFDNNDSDGDAGDDGNSDNDDEDDEPRRRKPMPKRRRQ